MGTGVIDDKTFFYEPSLQGAIFPGIPEISRINIINNYMEIYDDEFLRISTLPYDLIGLINFIYTKEYKLGDVIKLLNNPNKRFDGIDGNFYFKDNMIERDLNILKINSIITYIKKKKPNYFIHCAGLSRPMSIHDKNLEKCATFFITRMRPKRENDILNGGSIFWVFKRLILARQKIIGFDNFMSEDNILRCKVILDRKIILTDPYHKKPFQGWRYFSQQEAPKDREILEASGETLSYLSSDKAKPHY